MVAAHLEQGRAAYDARDWATCRDELEAADREAALHGDDLQRLGVARFLVGDGRGCLETLARGHREAVAGGLWDVAAETAFWHGWILYARAEHAPANGWIARARRLIADHSVTGRVAVLPLAVEARQLVDAGQPGPALELAEHVAAEGHRLHSPELGVLGLLGSSMALLRLGRGHEALPLLDEVMVAVQTEELLPTVAGLAYCGVIAACMSLFDVRRAAEWTAALWDWCETQSGLVPYRGQCLVHRAQILGLQGDWPGALVQARLACDNLEGPALGDAWYQLGELHRLRGAYDEAEAAYRHANAAGRMPEPGLALVRLAQGRVDAAATVLRRLVAEPGRLDRLELLGAHVEVMARAGDLAAAERAAAEIRTVADDLGSALVHARSAEAAAVVAAAQGRTGEALRCLQQAREVLLDLGLPYLAARVRVRLAEVLDAVGDREAAGLERAAARTAFGRLGAAADLAALDGRPLRGEGLTPREVEVIRLVATGLSNRRVAEQLCLSEKTVARHLANIYTKLGLSSRTAATAYAYDRGLVGG